MTEANHTSELGKFFKVLRIDQLLIALYSVSVTYVALKVLKAPTCAGFDSPVRKVFIF